MASALDNAMRKLDKALERLEAGVARRGSGLMAFDDDSDEADRLAGALDEAEARAARLEEARREAAEGVAEAAAAIRAVLAAQSEAV